MCLFFCCFFLPSCFVLLLPDCSCVLCPDEQCASVLSSSSSSLLLLLYHNLFYVLLLFSCPLFVIFSTDLGPPCFSNPALCPLLLFLNHCSSSSPSPSLFNSPFSSSLSPLFFLDLLCHLSPLYLCFFSRLLVLLPLFPLSLVGPEQRRLKVRTCSSLHLIFWTLNMNLTSRLLLLSVSNIDHVVLDEDHSGSRRLQNLWR